MSKAELIQHLTEIPGNPEIYIEGVRGFLDPIYTVSTELYQQKRALVRSSQENEPCVVLA